MFLTDGERARLRPLIGRGEAPARLLTRARLRRTADQGEGGAAWTDAVIACALEVDATTIARVRRACVERGLEAALARKAPDRVYPGGWTGWPRRT